MWEGEILLSAPFPRGSPEAWDRMGCGTGRAGGDLVRRGICFSPCVPPLLPQGFSTLPSLSLLLVWPQPPTRTWASSILNAQRPGTPTLVVVSTSAMSAVRDPGMLKYRCPSPALKPAWGWGREGGRSPYSHRGLSQDGPSQGWWRDGLASRGHCKC